MNPLPKKYPIFRGKDGQSKVLWVVLTMAPQPAAATHSPHWAAGRKSQTDAQELYQGQHQIVGEPRATGAFKIQQ